MPYNKDYYIQYSIENTVNPNDKLIATYRRYTESEQYLLYLPRFYTDKDNYGLNFLDIEITLNDDTITKNFTEVLVKDVKHIKIWYDMETLYCFKFLGESLEHPNYLKKIDYVKIDNLGEYSNQMFKNCKYLTSFNYENIDTRNVFDMSETFMNCINLKNLDLSRLDTLKTENLSHMFDGCISLLEADFSNKRLRNVKNMSYMFRDCKSLKLANFDNVETNNLVHMHKMFENCTSLSYLDLSYFNTHKVIENHDMFKNLLSPTVKVGKYWSYLTGEGVYMSGPNHFVEKDINFIEYTIDTSLYPDDYLDTEIESENGKYYRYLPIEVDNKGTKLKVFLKDDYRTYKKHVKISEVEKIRFYNYENKITFCPVYEEKITDDSLIPLVKDVNFIGFSCIGMFANCKYLESIDVSHSEINEDTSYMFAWCESLRSINMKFFNGTIRTSHMFEGTKLDELTNFNTLNVMDMSYMFTNCTKVPKLEFNVGNVNTFEGMFKSSNISNVDCFKSWKPLNASTMSHMFENTDITNLDVTNWFSNNITDTSYMFKGCYNLTSINRNSDLKNVINASHMFEGCYNLSSINLFNLDSLTAIEDTSYMFKGCFNLTKDLFYTKCSHNNLKKCDYMYEGCSSLKQIVFDNFNLNSIEGLFKDCSSLEEIIIRNEITDLNVKSISHLFDGCNKLKDVQQIMNGLFNNTEITDMSYTFRNCNSLTKVDLFFKDTSSVTNTSYMFYNCNSLLALDLEYFNSKSVEDTTNMFYNVKCKYIFVDDDLWTLDIGENVYGHGINKFVEYEYTNISPYYVEFTINNTLYPDDPLNAFYESRGYKYYKYLPRIYQDVYTYDINYDKILIELKNGYITDDLTIKVSEVKSIRLFFDENIYSLKFYGYFEEQPCLVKEINYIYLNKEITDISYMFRYCSYLETVELSLLQTENVDDMRGIFFYCKSLDNLELYSFDTSKVQRSDDMFTYIKSKTINVGYNWTLETGENKYGHGYGNRIVKNNSYVYDTVVSYSINLYDDVENYRQYLCGSKNSYYYKHIIYYKDNSIKKIEQYSLIENENLNNIKRIVSILSCRDYALLVGQYVKNLIIIDASNASNIYFSNNPNYSNYEPAKKDSTIYSINFATKNCFRINETNYNFLNNLGIKKLLNLGNIDTSNVNTMYDMFYNCSSLTTLDLSNFDTSNVTTMCRMFYKCSSLTSLDLSSFNTSKVTNMNVMFSECSSLTTLDLSNFDTSNVTAMQSMFYGCSKLTSLDLSSFNTSNVTTMYSMFNDCSSLTTLNLSNFDTSKVTTMFAMFISCSSLNTLNLSNFDTSSVTNMEYMFSDCSSLTSLNISSFNTSKVINMGNMFDNCNKLTLLDLPNFDNSKVEYMNSMFNDCSSLTTLNLSNFGTSSVTNMNNMFNNCKNLQILDLSSFDTKNVTDMSYMFSGCKTLNKIDITLLNSQSLINSSYMFQNCEKLKFVDLSQWYTPQINTKYMFSGCHTLTSISLGNFLYFSNNLESMFEDCYALKTIAYNTNKNFNDFKLISTAKMFKNCMSLQSFSTDMFGNIKIAKDSSEMFYNCKNLIEITYVDELVGSETTKMDGLFYNCEKLKYITLAGTNIKNYLSWTTHNVTSLENVFYNCLSLDELYLTTWNTSKVTNYDNMFYNLKSDYVYIGSSWNGKTGENVYGHGEGKFVIKN